MTATAIFPGGKTSDVTATTEWTTSAAQVATISSTGVLTGRGLGLVTVTAFYYPERVSAQAVVTPAGTFVLAGRAREPGAGPLGGVMIVHMASGTSVVTGNDGRFSLGGMTHPARLSLTKASYEPLEFDAFPNLFLEPPMQRIILVNADSSTLTILAPNDMEYIVGAGAACQPCRLVRLMSSSAGTLRVRVSWDGDDAAVNVWASGRMFPGSNPAREVTADLTVAAGETILYIGRLPNMTRLFLHTKVSISASSVMGGD